MLTTRRTFKLEFHRHVDEIMAGSFTVRQSETCAFIFGFDRSAVLNIWARLVIGFMKHHIVQLAHINHFAALLTFIAVPFLLFVNSLKSAAFICYTN